MQYKTQTDAVLAHLQEYGSITSIQAIQEYGVTRLSAVIFKLRRSGHRITTEPFQVTTRYGTKAMPVKYILKKEDCAR